MRNAATTSTTTESIVWVRGVDKREGRACGDLIPTCLAVERLDSGCEVRRSIWPCEEYLGYNGPETACTIEILGAVRVSTAQTSTTTGPSFSNPRGS